MAAETTPRFGESIIGFEGSSVSGLLGVLAAEAANPLDDEGREALVDQLEDFQHGIANAAGRLYETCWREDLLTPGEHADPHNPDVKRPYVGKSFTVGDLFVRVKFIPDPNAEKELRWFSAEVVPNVEGKEVFLTDETVADTAPFCGVRGNVVPVPSDGSYRRLALVATPSISDFPPRTREEYFERGPNAIAFTRILDACRVSLY